MVVDVILWHFLCNLANAKLKSMHYPNHSMNHACIIPCRQSLEAVIGSDGS